MAFHSKISVAQGVHILHAYEYADSTTRLAATGFLAADVGKVARQISDSTYWVLSNHAPVTWKEITNDGAVGIPSTRTITAGAGLTGGGDLSIDRTIDIVAGDGSIAVAANSIAVGTLQNDTQHGNRGGGAVHAAATTAVAGFMSAADKTKLDGVAVSATNTPLSSSLPSTIAAASGIGGATTAARADHAHAHGAQSDPTMHSAATTGANGFMSSADKTKLDGIAAGATSTPLTSATPASVGVTNVVGVAATAARADHAHAHGAQTDGSLHAAATTAVAGFLSSTDKTKLDGVAAGATNTPLSSAAAQAVGTSSSAGVSTDAARADHVHAHGAQTDATLHAVATTGANGFLSAADKTKIDGVASGATNTPLSAVAAQNVGTTNAVGIATSAARADHVHAHGVQADGTLHAVATTAVAGFLSATDKVKLDALPTSLIFGTQFQEFFDATPFATASVANVAAASFTTTNVPAGTYRVAMEWVWRYTSATSEPVFGIYIDGALQDTEFLQEPSEVGTDQRNPFGWFTYSVLAAGTHTLELRVRNTAGGQTTTIDLVNCEFWRVS